MSAVLAPFRLLLAMLAVFVFGLAGMLMRLFGATPHQVVYWIGHRGFGRFILFVSGIRLRVEGKENLHPSPAIYVSNHTSQMDIPAITSAIDIPLFFVAKSSLRSIPFLGWYMRATGMIFVDRGNREKAMQSMRDAAESIKSGKSILSFPEGTRSPNGQVQMFRRGTFVIAKEGALPVVPLAVSGTFHSLPKSSWVIRPAVVHVRIGKVLEPALFVDSTIEQMAAVAQDAVSQLKSKA